MSPVEVVLCDIEPGFPETPYWDAALMWQGTRSYGETTGKIFSLTAPLATPRNVNEDAFKVALVPATLTKTTEETMSESCQAESNQLPKS